MLHWPKGSRNSILFRLGWKGKCIYTKRTVWKRSSVGTGLRSTQVQPLPVSCLLPVLPHHHLRFCFSLILKRPGLDTDTHSGRRKGEMFWAGSIFENAQSTRNPWWVSSCCHCQNRGHTIKIRGKWQHVETPPQTGSSASGLHGKSCSSEDLTSEGTVKLTTWAPTGHQGLILKSRSFRWTAWPCWL